MLEMIIDNFIGKFNQILFNNKNDIFLCLGNLINSLSINLLTDLLGDHGFI